uniref:Secreted protein n=1 Tax=Panagrellus redivivus TaxID=6233 RepID=A0A7E4VRV1_PANRE
MHGLMRVRCLVLAVAAFAVVAKAVPRGPSDRTSANMGDYGRAPPSVPIGRLVYTIEGADGIPRSPAELVDYVATTTTSTTTAATTTTTSSSPSPRTTTTVRAVVAPMEIRANNPNFSCPASQVHQPIRPHFHVICPFPPF